MLQFDLSGRLDLRKRQELPQSWQRRTSNFQSQATDQFVESPTDKRSRSRHSTMRPMPPRLQPPSSPSHGSLTQVRRLRLSTLSLTPKSHPKSSQLHSRASTS